jgi:uncharacterized protein (TIGR01777 family)
VKIIVAGGTGLIGSALLKRLAGKNDVVILTRRAEEAHRQFEGAGFHILDWNQPKEQLVAALDKSDALINLSGAGIADFRWTDKRKAALLKSRIEPIRKLTHLMREANLRIGMIIQASAIGFYGHHHEKLFTETDDQGNGYLAGLTAEWEAAAQSLKAFTNRLVLIRTGVVLSSDGGALKPMMLPFRFFLGGKIGSGRQWVSWIDIEDQIEAMLFLLKNNSTEGVYNLTAPQAVRQSELAFAIGKAMKRLSWIPVPAFALKLMLGQMADEMLLKGAAVKPDRLLQAGFQFQSPDIHTALNHVIGYPKK